MPKGLNNVTVIIYITVSLYDKNEFAHKFRVNFVQTHSYHDLPFTCVCTTNEHNIYRNLLKIRSYFNM